MPRRRSSRHRRASGTGAWFVTLWCRSEADTLGAVTGDTVSLSAAGRLVERCWLRLPSLHPAVRVDTHVVMPNHLHGILWLEHAARPLPAIVGMFKGQTNRIARQYLWDRGYAGQPIRDAAELDALRGHIARNPLTWSRDPENPASRAAADALDGEAALGWRP